LEAANEAFTERLLVVLGLMDGRDVLFELARGNRPPEGAARKIGHDARYAPPLVAAVSVTAGVNLLRALARRSRDLRVRPADLHGADPNPVQRNFLKLRFGLVESLSQLREAFRRRVRRRRECFRRRLGALRRIRPA